MQKVVNTHGLFVKSLGNSFHVLGDVALLQVLTGFSTVVFTCSLKKRVLKDTAI